MVGGGPDVDTIDGGGTRVRGSVAAVALPLVANKKLALSQFVRTNAQIIFFRKIKNVSVLQGEHAHMSARAVEQ